MPHKILLISSNFPPKVDGIGDYSCKLASYFKLNKYDIGIFTKGKNQNSWDKVKSDGYQIFNNDSDSWNFFSIYKLYKILRQYSPNTVILQYEPFSYSKYGLPIVLPIFACMAKCFGVKLIVYYHEIALRILHFGFKSGCIGFLQRIIAYSTAIFADVNNTNTKLYSSYLRPLKSNIIPVPSNITNDYNATSLNLYKGSINILCFSNRVSDAIFESISNLTSVQNYDLRLLLIGKVGLEKRTEIRQSIIKYSIKSFVDFNESTLSEQDLASYFKVANIYIQNEYVNEYSEGGVSTKSGAIAAALSFSKVIISTCGDMTDKTIFQNNFNILFAEYNNTDSLSNIMSKVLNDKNLYNELSNNAYSTYQKYFTWKTTIDSYIKHLNL